MPSAPESRPSRTAVGWASPRSILVIIARETPERSASAFTERSWAIRAACTVAASESERSTLATIATVVATIVT
jgi:hypothetical protein